MPRIGLLSIQRSQNVKEMCKLFVEHKLIRLGDKRFQVTIKSSQNNQLVSFSVWKTSMKCTCGPCMLLLQTVKTLTWRTVLFCQKTMFRDE
jgi:hypothetical protein